MIAKFSLSVIDVDGNEFISDYGDDAPAALQRFRSFCRHPDTEVATILRDDGESCTRFAHYVQYDG